MGLRGPAPKPKKMNTIKFEPGIPEPPRWLDDEAKREYKVTAEKLIKAGHELQQPDGGILALYAQAVADVARLTLQIREEGEVVEGYRGGTVKNPRMQALSAARQLMIQAGAKLGFSPADRNKVPAPPSTGPREFADI